MYTLSADEKKTPVAARPSQFACWSLDQSGCWNWCYCFDICTSILLEGAAGLLWHRAKETVLPEICESSLVTDQGLWKGLWSSAVTAFWEVLTVSPCTSSCIRMGNTPACSIKQIHGKIQCKLFKDRSLLHFCQVHFNILVEISLIRWCPCKTHVQKNLLNHSTCWQMLTNFFILTYSSVSKC